MQRPQRQPSAQSPTKLSAPPSLIQRHVGVIGTSVAVAAGTRDAPNVPACASKVDSPPTRIVLRKGMAPPPGWVRRGASLGDAVELSPDLSGRAILTAAASIDTGHLAANGALTAPAALQPVPVVHSPQPIGEAAAALTVPIDGAADAHQTHGETPVDADSTDAAKHEATGGGDEADEGITERISHVLELVNRRRNNAAPREYEVSGSNQPVRQGVALAVEVADPALPFGGRRARPARSIL